MIIVAIEGGLGNQMFEYAFYLSLREVYGSEQVKVDLHFVNSNMHNGYELQRVFGLCPPQGTIFELIKNSDYFPQNNIPAKMIEKLFLIRRRIRGRSENCIVQGDATKYLKICYALDKQQNYFLKGVWANAKYFMPIASIVRKTYTFPEIVDDTNHKWKKLIQETTSVSIHFRGGDYYQGGFQVLSQPYYWKAMEYVEKSEKAPVYFVFTDDVEHAREALGEVKCNCYFVDNNSGENSYRDMQLMSLCKHNIIANSTFSFWGAFLNENPSKIVVAPRVTAGICEEPYQLEDWVLI